MKPNRNHPSARYAAQVVAEKIPAPSYVIKQCREWLRIWDEEDPVYCINRKLLKNIDKIAVTLVMARGPRAGEPIAEALAGYQWLVTVAALCTVRRDDKRRRKYKNILLEICRKNGKTFLVAWLFLLCFYLEPDYSRLFSVAPDGRLAKELKEALEPLIKANLDVFQDNEFKIRRDDILHRPTQNRYIPLNYSTSRMDSVEPSVFIADEVGALPNIYAVEAMRSGQLLVENKLGFVISTKYPRAENPFEDEVAYAKKVLDGLQEDEGLFALLYEPDNKKDWSTDDRILMEGNPLALEIPEVWEELLQKRSHAIEVPSARENFITKHCNIIYQGRETFSYVPIEELRKCRVDEIDWPGRTVYCGVDLAISGDNCAAVMVGVDDDGSILCEPMCFIPEGRMAEKTQLEKVDYKYFCDVGQCIACGDLTVDYSVIEKYVFDLEDKFGVKIAAVCYDRANCLSSAQKWAEKYDCVEIRQHSDTLHPAFKYLQEQILSGKFKYKANTLYEMNIENAKMQYDSTMRMYADKRKQSWKIDMLFGTVDALCQALKDKIFNQASILNAIDAFLEE